MPSYRLRPTIAVVALLFGPLLVVPLALTFHWLSPEAAAATLGGYFVASLGGLAAGAVAERLLHRGEGSTQQLVGLVITTALGVLTIGYLYLIHLRGPMDAINTPERILSQTLPFVAFLTAQAAGILLTSRRAA